MRSIGTVAAPGEPAPDQLVPHPVVTNGAPCESRPVPDMTARPIRPCATPSGSSRASGTSSDAEPAPHPLGGRRLRSRRRARLRIVRRSVRPRRRARVAHQPGRARAPARRAPGRLAHRRPHPAAPRRPAHGRTGRPARAEHGAVPHRRRAVPGRGGRTGPARRCVRRQPGRPHGPRRRPVAGARAGHGGPPLPGHGALLRPARPGRAHDDVQHGGHPGERRARAARPGRATVGAGQPPRPHPDRLLRQLALRRGPPERLAVQPPAGLVVARPHPLGPGALRPRSRRRLVGLRARRPGDAHPGRRRPLRAHHRAAVVRRLAAPTATSSGGPRSTTSPTT